MIDDSWLPTAHLTELAGQVCGVPTAPRHHHPRRPHDVHITVTTTDVASLTTLTPPSGVDQERPAPAAAAGAIDVVKTYDFGDAAVTHWLAPSPPARPLKYLCGAKARVGTTAVSGARRYTSPRRQIIAELDFRVERTTGIEPASSAWKVSRR